MLIPSEYLCAKCGKPQISLPIASQTSIDWTCQDCGHENHVFLSSNQTIGIRIHQRSDHELRQTKDFSLAIILAAMAVECELSRVFSKWHVLLNQREFTSEEIETELRKYRSIADKIEGVCKLIHPPGIEAWVTNAPLFARTVRTSTWGLRLNSLPVDFQEKIFWPRNRILHSGFMKYGFDDAERVVSISFFLLMILMYVDAERSKL